MSLRDQLQAVYDQHGQLTPELVVQTAAPADHPLHDRFEWDDSVAGHAWRKHQAQELIRTQRVVYAPATETTEERSVRAFHAIRKETGYVYEPVEKVVEDEFTRKLLLTDMEREWWSLFDRFSEFQEFLDLVAADARKARRKKAA